MFFQMHFRFSQFLLLLLALALPLIALRGQRIELCLQAAARLDDELDLRFQAADLGIGLVQMALRNMHAIAGGVMRLAHVLQVRLDMAQLRGLFLQIGLRLFDFAKEFFLFRLGFVLAQQPKQLLLFILIGLQLPEFLCDGCLRFQLFQIRGQLAQDVFDTGQVFACVLQAVFGFPAALLVLGYAGGFF